MSENHYLERPGARLAYRVEGDAGTPVLLVMGYMAPKEAWRNQIPALAQQHRVACFDNRGAGGSSAKPGAYSTGLFAADAVALLDALGWQDAHVVGVSMGGMISQELALRHRTRVRSLTLIATHAGGMAARLPTRTGLGHFMRTMRGGPRQRIEALEHLLYPPEFLARCDREAVRKSLITEFGGPVRTRYRLSQMAAVMRHRTDRRLHRLEGLPALIVKPAQDLLIRPQQSDRLHQLIPGSRLIVFDDAGHGLIRQRFEDLNAALLGHFAAADEAA